MSVSIKRLHKPSEGGGGATTYLGKGANAPHWGAAWRADNNQHSGLEGVQPQINKFRSKGQFNRDLSPAANLEETMKINRSNLPHLLRAEDFIFKFGDNLSKSRDLL